MNSSVYLFILSLIVPHVVVEGYAVTKSPYDLPSYTDTKEDKALNSGHRGRDHAIIVRKTDEADLSEISNLLANESMSGIDKSNWGAKMKKLKARSSFQTQLLHRLQASDTAVRVLSHPEHCQFLDTADERDTCRLLWLEDTFRMKLEKAAKTASVYEGTETLWDSHNFNLQPSDPMMMNHIMMTSVDVDYFGGEQNCEDGCIVGFCEVAMLPIPSEDNKDRGYGPCIINLVVSPKHRRRGIASRMIQNAERFVGLYWAEALSSYHDMDEDDLKSEGILGLYVDEENTAAVSLYLREKFKISGRGTNVPGQLFLEKDVKPNFVYA